ncbi:tRNA epoxyqueuosine(34) reductase QueG [Salimicrobium salexigens]|uniref:Epoxyqueuosine reductase n=1 Tax=Salimicrobium salexigens TaxID=908941 RepID=A0ABY1KK19_9BACI|nr:tRNA epoxyqueuosine(34) reductase QueG [Salimicrobium salexigens]SIS44121.1 epoxyqueuosine reductase [Salimicrobium salexigens]
MDAEQLKRETIAYSKEIGIDKIGFASADVFGELKSRLIRQEQLGYHSGFEKGSPEERTEPERLLPSSQSIISIALAYPSKMENPPKNEKGARRGQFARASWGEDYHTVLREKLQLLGSFLREKVPEVELKLMVDTGELSDRAVAERAGIGFSGKNCAIITPEFGSYVYLGELVTNLPFAPDEPIQEGCGDCNICVDSCPTDALVQGGQLNANRCIAFLTQTKGFLEDEYRTKIGNRVYGCDTCQTVCPFNRKKDFHLHEEFEPDPEKVKPVLRPILRISNREFKEKFGRMAGSWRGKKPIQRNAILALGHYREIEAVEDLVYLMKNDPRPVIRGTAAYSLGKIGTPECFEELEVARGDETDEKVKEEMEKGLAFQVN